MVSRDRSASAAFSSPAFSRSSSPMRPRSDEQVTTTSLEALRLYTQSERARYVGRLTESVRLLEQALAADPALSTASDVLGADTVELEDWFKLGVGAFVGFLLGRRMR